MYWNFCSGAMLYELKNMQINNHNIILYCISTKIGDFYILKYDDISKNEVREEFTSSYIDAINRYSEIAIQYINLQ